MYVELDFIGKNHRVLEDFYIKWIFFPHNAMKLLSSIVLLKYFW